MYYIKTIPDILFLKKSEKFEEVVDIERRRIFSWSAM